MKTVAINLDDLSTEMELNLWPEIETAADRDGWYVVEFDAATEEEAWQRVADVLLKLAKAAQCEPRLQEE